MLTDRACQLLTAYVDGELGTRQRKLVQRLLHRSAEARYLLQQLQQDALTLRKLPRRPLGQDVSAKVLRALHDRPLQPARRRGLSQPAALQAWAGLAIAASVLLVIGAASYLYFHASVQGEPGHTPVLAHQQIDPAAPETKKPDVKAPGVTDPAVVVKSVPPKELVGPPKPDPSTRKPETAVVKVPQKPAAVEGPKVTPKQSPVAPVKDPAMDAELARQQNPDPKMEVFETVNLRLAVSLPLWSLDQDKSRQRVRGEFKADSAFRLDLGCVGNGKAFANLQARLQAHGIRLLIDQVAQARLKNRKLKTDYVVYCEGLTADELAKILEELGIEDKKAEAKHRGDGQYDNVVINRLTPADHAKLSELLGVDPILLQPPRRDTPLGVDLRKPLSEGTAAQVAQAVTGPGGARPAPAKPGTEREALVLAYNPVRQRTAASKEIKAFLDNRKERRAGSIQVVLILRGANG